MNGFIVADTLIGGLFIAGKSCGPPDALTASTQDAVIAKYLNATCFYIGPLIRQLTLNNTRNIPAWNRTFQYDIALSNVSDPYVSGPTLIAYQVRWGGLRPVRVLPAFARGHVILQKQLSHVAEASEFATSELLTAPVLSLSLSLSLSPSLCTPAPCLRAGLCAQECVSGPLSLQAVPSWLYYSFGPVVSIDSSDNSGGSTSSDSTSSDDGGVSLLAGSSLGTTGEVTPSSVVAGRRL